MKTVHKFDSLNDIVSPLCTSIMQYETCNLIMQSEKCKPSQGIFHGDHDVIFSAFTIELCAFNPRLLNDDVSTTELSSGKRNSMRNEFNNLWLFGIEKWKKTRICYVMFRHLIKGLRSKASPFYDKVCHPRWTNPLLVPLRCCSMDKNVAFEWFRNAHEQKEGS